MPAEPDNHRWEDMKVGMSVRVPIQFSRAELERFAEISGDRNPLHLDANFARSRGYEREVVYGALILAKISGLIGMKLPGLNSVWMSSTIAFREPLLVDQKAELRISVKGLSESTRLATLEVQANIDDRVLAKGRVEVIVRGEVGAKAGTAER